LIKIELFVFLILFYVVDKDMSAFGFKEIKLGFGSVLKKHTHFENEFLERLNLFYQKNGKRCC